MRYNMIFHKKHLTYLFTTLFVISINAQNESKIKKIDISSEKGVSSFYQNLQIDRLDQKIFGMAIKGYLQFKEENTFDNPNFLTIVDYSRSSNEKRLYVVDLLNCKVLFHELVAHGKNSGNEFAKKFSNEKGSSKSSLGFYCTAYIYYNSFGYALKLIGLEKGINDHAFERGLVFHGSKDINFDFIDKHKTLKQSDGCLTVSHQAVNLIIDKIKDGSCIFVYAEDEEYFNNSKLFKSNKK